MKIIFLDIDGVLNSGRWNNSRGQSTGVEFEHFNSEARMIDPVAVGRLNQIIEATRALVVISSSWRMCFTLPMIEVSLRDRGFKGTIIGMTSCNMARDGMTLRRGEEIREWLDAVDGVDDFVAIDDETREEMAAVSKNFVQTWYATGLLDTHVKRAISILNGTS